VLQSFDDIILLANEIGNNYLSAKKVNLKKIARDNEITIVVGNYGNCFVGQLTHYMGEFFILLNKDELEKAENGRLRFTIAHELGHFFIDDHRSKLRQGISLSFKGISSEQKFNKFEHQANSFAANLLMPKENFIRRSKKIEIGIPGILKLKTIYDTSIEGTALRYVNLNLQPCLMIRWHPDLTPKYKIFSNLLSSSIGIQPKNISIRYDKEYLAKRMRFIDLFSVDYTEDAARLSKWVPIIDKRKDLLGLEQTIKLGEFGAITLLVFS